ncbi:MAG: hypothetical protein WAU77_13700 [Solirubrobacteraceae bacterium]
MPATSAIPSVSPEPAVSAVGLLSGRRITAGGVEREQLLDRLAQLRAILPAFAEELATARRQTAALRVENRGLLAKVRRLQRQRGETHAHS